MIFIALLQCTFIIQSLGWTSQVETASGSDVKDAELISYNTMLDLCLNLKEWVPELNMSNTNASSLLAANVNQWNNEVTKFADQERGSGYLVITVSNISYEPYNGQPIDKFQMNYIGTTGNEKWHIYGTITVKIANTWMAMISSYNISIIA